LIGNERETIWVLPKEFEQALRENLVAARYNEINPADNFIVMQNISSHSSATGWFGANISPHGRRH